MRSVLLLLLFLCAAAPVAAADPLGTVGRVQGQVEAVRAAQVLPLAVGDAVRRADLLRTGARARLQVDLVDGSVLTLGAEAVLQLNDVVVPEAPADGPFMDLLSGAFRLVAAKVSDARAADRRIRTPAATIGIRGTDVWGGPLDGALDVLVLEGAVAVSTPAGETLLGPGQGTVVATAGAAPGPAVFWDEEKVGRAVATIRFAGDE